MGIADMFAIQRLQYLLSARQPLSLNMDLPSISVRGAFGYALKELLDTDRTIIDTEFKAELFRRIFKPRDPGNEPGRITPARCFVIRGEYADAGHCSFAAEFILFGRAAECEPVFDNAMRILGRAGLGRDHAVCQVEKTASDTITPYFPECGLMTVDFQTPTQIKSRGRMSRHELPFELVMSRLIDRCRDIASSYGGDDDAYDYVGLKRAARLVMSERVAGGRFNATRKSSLTGDEIWLDGFVGRMLYRGDFAPFAPFLAMLPWVHVGRGTVYGCGWPVVSCHSITD